MKKLFTLVSAVLLTATAFARQPQVVITTDGNILSQYEVTIDGRIYTGNTVTIPDLNQGRHTVEVYEVKRATIFGNKRRTLISSQQFYLGNNDVQIDVDRNGQVRIRETGNYNGGNNNGGWNGRDNDGVYRNNRDCNCDCKRYDHSNGNWNNGRGNKYGHYKKNKNGKGKWDKHHDDDDDR